MTDDILRLEAVTMSWDNGDGGGRTVLDGADLRLARGEAVSLVGRSGSGKSTLLHVAAGIAVPTSGRVTLAGHDLTGSGEEARTRLRRDHVGLVFQFFHLLPHLSLRENVAVPAWIAGDDRARTRERVDRLLARVGLLDRAGDPVGRLSGGEQQRVALCRALLRAPALVLADEPTGSLDDRTGSEVMDLLLDLTRQEGGSLLYVTHSRELAARADRSLRLVDGRLQAEAAA
ncbi:MAG: ABC transporter ATP-binding protein [bacterium]|jgi:putative ABC transport system ATP-binding protein|nr:ABC transporter ATP-binding protein [bacterium]MBK7769751.1 ABC transporter ATP-binding protein [bacterium]MBK9474240.1 ABC transporter ATP-binding protein [bacterium]MBK9775965.1 ABC transporter ATP-binding protein [bacterium]